MAEDQAASADIVCGSKYAGGTLGKFLTLRKQVLLGWNVLL